MQSVSLTRYLIEEQRAGRINAELRQLIAVVARACTSISIAVSKGALGGVLGDAGTPASISMNVQGEAQKKLDVLSNEILLEANAWGGHLAACASEEMDHCQPIPDAYPRGNYLLLFDPLDGSSNIDVNVSVGTIFSVLRCPDGVTTAGGRALPAARHRAGRGRLLHLRAEHDAGADRRPRHARLHPGPRAGRVRADPARHAHSRGDRRSSRSTCPTSAIWEAPMQAYVDDLLAGKRRPARQGLQHALDRDDGRRRASHPDPRRHLHLSAGTARMRVQGRQAAPDVRGQPDGACWWNRPAARRAPGASACWTSPRPACTSACRCSSARKQRSRGRRALPPRHDAVAAAPA